MSIHGCLCLSASSDLCLQGELQLCRGDGFSSLWVHQKQLCSGSAAGGASHAGEDPKECTREGKERGPAESDRQQKKSIGFKHSAYGMKTHRN